MIHYNEIKENTKNTTLVVVSKQQPLEKIQTYYDLDERIFAENRAQELKQKATLLPKDIQWHFIGHLQRNKVKDVIPYVSCIQSLDSIRLAKEINKECKKLNKIMPCLVEFHFAKEDTNKTGIDPKDAITFIEAIKDLEHIQLVGMMTMGPHTDNEEEIRNTFKAANELFKTLQEKYNFQILSMGMSSDYKLAIENGSTMVRIGSKLFKD